MSVGREEMARRLGVQLPVRDGADGTSRRTFVKLLGASIALAGLDGCTRMPASNIYPYVKQPELTPGIPQYYATSMVLDGFATGLLVESHEGRPTKVEGNPDHPASLGAAGVYEQASVLQLYDPDRARRVREGTRTASWHELAAALAPGQMRTHLGRDGAGLFLLMEPTSSPLECALLDRILEMYPSVRVHFHAPLVPSNHPLIPQYDLGEADVILAVDADFLASGPFHLQYARHFAARRRPEAPGGMNRCYVIEPSVSVTGTAADHRLAMRPGEIVQVLEELAAAVRGDVALADRSRPDGSWLSAVARDLRAHAGRSLVIAGPYLPARGRALALEINQALGNVGRTLWFTRSPLAGGGAHSIGALVDALRAGDVDTLICAGGNPSYASAGVHGLSGLIRRARQSVYLGLYENETAHDCRWMVPAAHFLESWGDARAYDGTLSIVQPLIDPIAGGKTTSELLSLLLGDPDRRAYDLLRESWNRSGVVGGGSEFEDGWRAALGRGLVAGSAFPREQGVPTEDIADMRAPELAPIEVVFRPHPRVHDGVFGNNGWLQELPDPVTTLTWENAAQLSPGTAQRLGVISGDVIDIQASERAVRIAALVVNGQADDTVTLHFGYGRDGAEALARGAGVNVYPLWPGEAFQVGGAKVSHAPGMPVRNLAITQPHRSLESSDPVRVITLAELAHQAPPRPRALTLYEAPATLPDGPAPQQWAMSIDLGACTGCGACMVACQAENNVPVVGREQVLRGREMHWLRIDWYDPPSRDRQSPAISQPMLCQQCEKAPCEYVCPVEATVHSSDGLNEMIYNRCVGTRFCSNNCPYKVRRFNWFDFNAALSETEQMVKNPDVTVRERGVMEKCTFCVQRIRQAEIAARVDGRPIRGNEVETACQQACPTRAIVFGSLTDQGSQVVRDRTSPRAYSVLEDLATGPRVRYLARVRNANPDLERPR